MRKISEIVDDVLANSLPITKQAAKWEDLSYEAQKKYLQEHRKSKKKMTAKPGQDGADVSELKEGIEEKRKEISKSGWKMGDKPFDVDKTREFIKKVDSIVLNDKSLETTKESDAEANNVFERRSKMHGRTPYSDNYDAYTKKGLLKDINYNNQHAELFNDVSFFNDPIKRAQFIKSYANKIHESQSKSKKTLASSEDAIASARTEFSDAFDINLGLDDMIKNGIDDFSSFETDLGDVTNILGDAKSFLEDSDVDVELQSKIKSAVDNIDNIEFSEDDSSKVQKTKLSQLQKSLNGLEELVGKLPETKK